MHRSSNLYKDMRDLIANRGEPEMTRPLATLFWRSLIGTVAAVLVVWSVVAVALYLSVLGDIHTATTRSNATVNVDFDQSRLTALTQALGARMTRSATTASQLFPTVSDPSR